MHRVCVVAAFTTRGGQRPRPKTPAQGVQTHPARQWNHLIAPATCAVCGYVVRHAQAAQAAASAQADYEACAAAGRGACGLGGTLVGPRSWGRGGKRGRGDRDVYGVNEGERPRHLRDMCFGKEFSTMICHFSSFHVGWAVSKRVLGATLGLVACI